MNRRSSAIVGLTLAAFALALSAPVSAREGYSRGGHWDIGELNAAIMEIGREGAPLASVSEIGQSVQGRALYAIRVARRDGKERPVAVIYSTVHANEWLGSRVSVAMAQRLVSGDGTDLYITQLLDRVDFRILPLMNPDGYAKASRHLDLGYTWARDNANHVDLNRNWPQAAGAEVDSPRGAVLGGSGFKWDPNYRGPHPLSEPENQALDRYVRQLRPFIVFDLHTTGGRFSYPWSFKEEAPPDKAFFEAVGRELTLHQDKLKYQVHQSYSWYQIVGASKDWFYGKYGVPAVTIELGNPARFDRKRLGPRLLNPFFRYNPIDVEAWIENDRDAILHAAGKAFELTGGVPREPLGMEWIGAPAE